MKKIILFFTLISICFSAYSTIEIKNHIGDYAEVCGKVYEVYYHRNGHIFINLDGKYPNQKMSFIIWRRYRDNFNNIDFTDKKICAKGIIKIYKGKPEIFLKNRLQLKIK